ncbi:uncharacterized protein LOC133335174 [Musca vetustissima]|uniref:uncharacterized protein LOC133335174 n=1 Tax=Musca vetustissima TaxID=27455 RepID=UPI002AB73E1A|nr:uncharacterized protein LOC133335174 [Musca vetustissima]
MVAVYNIDEIGQNPKTLGDWVKNFRLKKIQMKRKLRASGAELRVAAILSTALMSAEHELRRKQQERFQKWLEFQSKINKNHELQPPSEHLNRNKQHASKVDDEVVLVARRESDTQTCKQSEEITNLWKCELSELDNFMRSISSSTNSSCRDNSSIKQSQTSADESCPSEVNHNSYFQPQSIQVSS